MQYLPGQRESLLGQPIRSRAELRVGDTPVENPASNPGRYVPPAPPSWASIWPTESGWTGPGGVPSIRDEDFGGMEASFSPEDAKGKEKPSMDGDRESQYALDARPTEHTFGPFKLSPSLFGTTKHKHPEVDSVLDEPTATTTRPLSPQPLFYSPKLEDDDDEGEAVELTRLMDDTDQFERSATGNFTLAFGPHDPLARSGTSSTNTGKSTRSGSGRTKGHNGRAGQSRVDGQRADFVGFDGSAALLRSMESLRRVAASVEEREHLASGEESASGSVSPAAYSTPVRRLPALPGSSQIPPVPPVPRHHLTAPGEIRPLPVPISQDPPRVPDARAIPRTVSLGPGQIPPISSAVVLIGTMAARPLPVPPAANS
ncbi:hypothetical protein FRC10_002898 [Ceratobasidium sp. 414]|nr:hypothetical protein FRC10_002898 [Ceratobasidium sp. 414]